MNKKEKLIDEIREFPDDYINKIYDYVQYVKSNFEKEEKEELLTLSESSFCKGWINEKEDEIWQDL